MKKHILNNCNCIGFGIALSLVYLVLPHRSLAFQVPSIKTLSSRRTVTGLKNYPNNLGLDQEQQQQQQQEIEIYNEIKELMVKHDPILLFASRLLPPNKAKDAFALYAWCRRLDEITDDPDAEINEIQQRLIDWEIRFEILSSKMSDNEKNNHQQLTTTTTTSRSPSDDLMDKALSLCLERNKALTKEPFQDMIKGMKLDAVSNRVISNMEELEEYGYQVAGTVGLMLLPLLIDGDSSDHSTKAQKMEQARPPAIALGKAIQLINILRDARQDAHLGRVYLPQDMLSQENVKNEDIIVKKSSSKGYCNVVKRVAIRADELLQEAQIGKDTLPGVLGPLFVQIIVELYRGYLVKLKKMEYDNLNNVRGDRVKISTLQKLSAVGSAVATFFANENIDKERK